jgi:hypothetical protein
VRSKVGRACGSCEQKIRRSNGSGECVGRASKILRSQGSVVLRGSVLFHACLTSKVLRSGCKPSDIHRLSIITINDDDIFRMWIKAVFGPLYRGIAFRLCGWYLSTSSGPYAQVL